jgi:hypothetical protein
MKTIYAAAAASLSTGMSSLDIAIVTGGFTLTAAILGFIGNGFIQGRARRREARVQHERLISEALSAAQDLSDAVVMFAVNWGSLGVISDRAAILMREMTSNPELRTRALLREPESWKGVIVTGVSALLLGISVGRGEPERYDSRYLQLVFPALQRLRAALIPLRIASNPVIAEHARKLTEAAESWASNSRFSRRHYKTARDEWAQVFGDFRTATIASLDK